MNGKKYKSINEVSQLLSLNTHVIRYWDSKFDGISTRLNTKKQRFFNSKNIRKIEELKKVLYQGGKHSFYSLNLANKIIEKKNKDNQSNNSKSSSRTEKQLDITSLINVSKNLKRILDL